MKFYPYEKGGGGVEAERGGGHNKFWGNFFMRYLTVLTILNEGIKSLKPGGGGGTRKLLPCHGGGGGRKQVSYMGAFEDFGGQGPIPHLYGPPP